MTIQEFALWAQDRNIGLVQSLDEFTVGQTVTFTNENGVSFHNLTIIGIADENYDFHGRKFFLDKDSYWFPSHVSELSATPVVSQIEADKIVNGISFIADQIINNDVSTDAELAEHLSDECQIQVSTTKKIVKQLRPKAFRGEFTTQDDVLEAINEIFSKK